MNRCTRWTSFSRMIQSSFWGKNIADTWITRHDILGSCVVPSSYSVEAQTLGRIIIVHLRSLARVTSLTLHPTSHRTTASASVLLFSSETFCRFFLILIWTGKSVWLGGSRHAIQWNSRWPTCPGFPASHKKNMKRVRGRDRSKSDKGRRDMGGVVRTRSSPELTCRRFSGTTTRRLQSEWSTSNSCSTSATPNSFTHFRYSLTSQIANMAPKRDNQF